MCMYMFLCVYMGIYEFPCLPIEREILFLPKILLKVCGYFLLSMPEALVPFLAAHNRTKQNKNNTIIQSRLVTELILCKIK